MTVIGKLSALQIQRAKGPSVLHDGGGLYLRVSPSRRGAAGTEKAGSKSWVFRFQINGRRRDMGLGPYPDVSLADARTKATTFRQQRHGGTDPLEARRAERVSAKIAAARGRTFRQVAEEFIARNEAGWHSPRHAQQWRNTLATYVYPTLGEIPVAAIDAGMVVQVLDPIWTSKPETAIRVRGRVEAVLDAAKVRGFREGENPAQWRGNLALLLPARGKVRKVEHHAALPYDEMGGFMAALREQEGTVARALDFVILTAARTGEVLGARWSEISLSDRLWTVPAERMKARRDHRVPLSDPAVRVLLAVLPLSLVTDGEPDPSAPVFPSRRRALPFSSIVFLKLLGRMGRSDLTTHGFRSTFRDWAAERTNYPREVAEMALAHTIGNAVEAAYRRGDLFEKRRRLMEAWAKFCEQRPRTGKVVALRSAR